ncbi:957_t:CDS:1, partial [Paraglomus occultum]
IKERKITTSGFSPTINSLLINFGTTGAGMHEYVAELQVGKKYYFNGGNLENAKILTGNKLDINNSADKIPEIRVFNEEGEIITHGPVTPKKPLSSTIKDKILRNLDKISFDQAGHLANAELLKNPQNEYGTQQKEKAGVYQIKIDNEEINLRDFDRLENEKNWFEIRDAIVNGIKQNISD